MNPLVVVIALGLLFLGFRVAADVEDERMRKAGDEASGPRPFWRQVVEGGTFLLLLPFGVIFVYVVEALSRGIRPVTWALVVVIGMLIWLVLPGRRKAG